MSKQLVVDRPPGYLALAALLVSDSAIFERGQRTHERLDTGPDREPYLGHIGRSLFTVEPNILKSGKVFDLAHDKLHFQADLTFAIKVVNEAGPNLFKCGNIFPRATDQP